MANTYDTAPSSPVNTPAPAAPTRSDAASAAPKGYAAASKALSPRAKGKPAKGKHAVSGDTSAVGGTFQIGGASYQLRNGALWSGKSQVGRLTDAAGLAAALAAGAPPSAAPALLGEGGDAAAQSVDLMGAEAGSTFTYGTHAWTLHEGTWQELKRHAGKGYAKFGGGTVLKGLTALNDAGQLGLADTGKMVLSAEQIAILNAIAQVETSGVLGGVNTYDNMVVSLGFKQVTLGWGSLEQIMDWAPAGFAKHGLSLDKSKTYPKSSNIKADGVHKIAGAETAAELRQPEWALRFYHASLEPDVVSAQIKLALGDLGKVDRATGAAKGNGGYFDDPTARAWLLETYNNRHAFMAVAVKKARDAGAGSAADRSTFLDILGAAIVDAYIEQEPLVQFKAAKKKRGKLSADDEAKLLEDMKATYEPIGRKKGTNVITKIPRQLPGLSGGAKLSPLPSVQEAPEPSAVRAASRVQGAPGTTPLESADHQPNAESTIFTSAEAEALVSQLLAQGWHDESQLTNELFWRSNEHLRGKKLERGSREADEWLMLRDMIVRPLIPGVSRADAPVSAGPAAAKAPVPETPPTAKAPTAGAAPTAKAPTAGAAPTAKAPTAGAAPTAAKAPTAGPTATVAKAPVATVAKAPAATVAKAPAAGGAPAATTGTLTETEAISAISRYRSSPIDPTEMAAIQRHFGLADGGAIDLATVQAVASHRLAQHTGKKAPKGKARVALGVPNVALLTELGIARAVVNNTLGRNTKGVGTSQIAEDAALAQFGHTNYGAYLATLNTMTFLGQSVIGHPEFLARLSMAERYLLSVHKSASSADLGKHLGVTRTSSLRVSSPSSPQANHGIGFAVDLNPDLNPWTFANVGRPGGNKVFNNVAKRAARFLGGEVATASSLREGTRSETTEALFAKVDGMDRLFETYRGIAKLPDDALRGLITARFAADPSLSEAGDAAYWLKTIRSDDKALVGYLDAMGGEDYAKSGNGGIMDLRPSVVKAMRDVAGLRWGAVDLGRENGDTMHFDGYGTIAKCTNLRDAIRAQEQSASAG